MRKVKELRIGRQKNTFRRWEERKKVERTKPRLVAGVSNLRPAGCVQPGWLWMRPNTKLYSYLKQDEIFVVITCHNVFNLWTKTTLLPVWSRDANRLDSPGRGTDSGTDLQFHVMQKYLSIYLSIYLHTHTHTHTHTILFLWRTLTERGP